MDDYIMGETLHKWGIGKILREKYRMKFTVALGRANYLK